MTKKEDAGDIKIHEGKVELVDIHVLKPRPGNRKSHPNDQLAKLAEVFKSNGFRNPIIVSNQSGEIVCGTGRFLAAKLAGLKKVPVLYQDYDSPELEYAHHVADNAIPLWGELDLSGINKDIIELGPELTIEDLGLKGFELEPADKSKKKKKEITCPRCNETF